MATMDRDADLAFRRLAFNWLYRMTDGGSRSIRREEIATFKEHVPAASHHLILQQGIWKPAALLGTLSVTTGTPDGRKGRNVYIDTFIDDGLVEYAFTSATTKKHQNESLRQAHRLQLPIIYFRAIRPGLYDAYFPVYIQGIDEERRNALLDLTGGSNLPGNADLGASVLPVEIGYKDQVVQHRLHQRDFRSNVMFAYQTSCAICRLKKSRLLDAAHIRPDGRGGSAEISNGLSLCKIHHSAYDANILSITPDYTVHVDRSVLKEKDGPMLRHGLQEHHGQRLSVLPQEKKHLPDKQLLAERFEVFKLQEKS